MRLSNLFWIGLVISTSIIVFVFESDKEETMSLAILSSIKKFWPNFFLGFKELKYISKI